MSASARALLAAYRWGHLTRDEMMVRTFNLSLHDRERVRRAVGVTRHDCKDAVVRSWGVE